jgi:hypothetical protein
MTLTLGKRWCLLFMLIVLAFVTAGLLPPQEMVESHMASSTVEHPPPALCKPINVHSVNHSNSGESSRDVCTLYSASNVRVAKKAVRFPPPPFTGAWYRLDSFLILILNHTQTMSCPSHSHAGSFSLTRRCMGIFTLAFETEEAHTTRPPRNRRCQQ